GRRGDPSSDQLIGTATGRPTMGFSRFSCRIARQYIPLALSFPLLLSACSMGAPRDAGEQEEEVAEMAMGDGPLDGLVTVDRLPMPQDANLQKGREVWSGTCQGCHGLGIAGSPKITDRKA